MEYWNFTRERTANINGIITKKSLSKFLNFICPYLSIRASYYIALASVSTIYTDASTFHINISSNTFDVFKVMSVIENPYFISFTISSYYEL